MNFFELAKNRHSIRAFQEKKVDPEKIKKILEAARSAPSAGNLQAYKICVVKGQKVRQEIAEAADQEFLAEAPVILVFLAEPSQSSQKYGQRGEKLYSLQDATIASSYAQLAATSLGLGSCWVGAFDEEQVSEVIESPNDLKPVVLLPIGYPDEKPPLKTRRLLSELVWEKQE